MMRHEQKSTLSSERIIKTFVGFQVAKHPFLRNFQPAFYGKQKSDREAVKQLVVDLFRPDSEISYMLIGGIPGSGKTTLADAIADVIDQTGMDIWLVERQSFSTFRERAKREMAERSEIWTKAKETKTATTLMKEAACAVMEEGPFDPVTKRRRIVVAEMPIYTVDEYERGNELIEALGQLDRGRPYSTRRARVNFVKPDLSVVGNSLVTRSLGTSSGGTPEVIVQIAYKAFSGALLFDKLQPDMYKKLGALCRQTGLPFLRKRSLENIAADIIALRMLAILMKNDLYGMHDTVFMNPVRKRLTALSRLYPQRTLRE